MKKKIRINNHWKHWRAHIIILGIQTVQRSREDNALVMGLEICLLGFGIELYDNIIDWMLVNWWKVPKDNLTVIEKYFRMDL